MKKWVFCILVLLVGLSPVYAETAGQGACASVRAAQTYPVWDWADVRTITYDQDPGTHQTTVKVTLSNGDYIWTSNENARNIACQALSLGIPLMVNWSSQYLYTDVAIMSTAVAGTGNLHGTVSTYPDWAWADVTTITYETSGTHQGQWRIVLSDNSTIWTTDPTVLGIASEAYGLNIMLMVYWDSSTRYSYVAIMNTIV